VKTIALFNNKGGVGKTTLVYHLAHMLSRLGYPTLAVDLDPQANLTSAFFEDFEVEALLEEGQRQGLTILSCVNPILEGTGDIQEALPIDVAERLWTIVGDLGLSRFEDRLSENWPKCLMNDESALRVTSAFYRVTARAAGFTGATVVLFDVGPNLGAINRAALLAADFLVVPLAADLFSLQGLKNLGPTVRTWRDHWTLVRQLVMGKTAVDLPLGKMAPAGYVVLQHAVRLDRPVKAYGKWLDRIPAVYREAVLGQNSTEPTASNVVDEHCLATLRNFRSLMPMAQDARKPMFDLKPADGAIGSHAQLVQTCADEFRQLAETIAETCGLQQIGV
jgi:cellulose biosynthesis protein BcsQ